MTPADIHAHFDLQRQASRAHVDVPLLVRRERLLRISKMLNEHGPVLAAAVEEPVEALPSQPRAAAAEVFARWQGHLAEAFVADGHAPAEAVGLASLVIASVEGAVAMSRALQDIAPFDQVAAQLLQAAEDEARRRGCHGVFLYTYSFQAPGFYHKQGYQLMGVLEDCPPGYQRHYLKKSLQAQGAQPG